MIKTSCARAQSSQRIVPIGAFRLSDKNILEVQTAHVQYIPADSHTYLNYSTRFRPRLPYRRTKAAPRLRLLWHPAFSPCRNSRHLLARLTRTNWTCAVLDRWRPSACHSARVRLAPSACRDSQHLGTGRGQSLSRVVQSRFAARPAPATRLRAQLQDTAQPPSRQKPTRERQGFLADGLRP